MKFDFIIGNPPYQEEIENNGRKKPIYNTFMDNTYKLGDVVELITPARFLFNAGQTPKKWNEKMLNDPHFNILHYEGDGSKIFPNTEIKGGVAISYWDRKNIIGPIKIFTAYNELNHILNKLLMHSVYDEGSLDNIVSSRGQYRLTDIFFKDFPDAASKLGTGTANMLVSNIIEKVPDAFLTTLPNDGKKYIKILGRVDNSRVYHYIKKNYLINNDFVGTYNVLLPEANGRGTLGEILSTPLIAEPFTGATDTFISIGMFKTKYEALSCLKYIKSKFTRLMLSILKATQHTPKSVWKYVPLQDFTKKSDIDWLKSIKEIDQQLYKKYNLDKNEIAFIESHVKEME